MGHLTQSLKENNMKKFKNFRKNSGNTLCSNIGLYGSVSLPNRNDTSKIGYTQPYINPYSTIPSDSFPSPSKTKSAPLKNSDVTLSPSLTEWQNNGGKTASIVQSCQQTSSLASLTEKSAIKTRLSMDKISDSAAGETDRDSDGFARYAPSIGSNASGKY